MTDKKKRTLFFWILSGLFAVTASALIPYSMGYRFSLSRGIFVYTGSITLKTNPQNISVAIDKKVFEKGRLNFINSSYHIGGMDPGEHFIEVTIPDFHPWNKKVVINSGISTEFWNIQLIRQDYPRTQYQTPLIGNLFYDSQKRMAAYVENDKQILRVNVLDVANETTKNVFNSDEYAFTPDPKENIEWSPKLLEIIIPTIKDGIKNYFIVDTDTKKSTDLQELIETKNLDKVRWDPTNQNYIYYLSEKSLYRLNVNDPQDKKMLAENIASYDLSGNKIYYFQLPDGIVYSLNQGGSSTPNQITTSIPENMDDPLYQVTTYDEDRLALLNKNGDLYILNNGGQKNYFRKLASGIKGLQFSDDGKKILFWSDWEIRTYFLRDWEVQPFRSENEERDITRFSEPISNAQWSKDYEHVIFVVGNKIKIIEIDNRDQGNLTDITSLEASATKIVSDFPSSKIFFIDTSDGIPYLYSLNFPETSTLF